MPAFCYYDHEFCCDRHEPFAAFRGCVINGPMLGLVLWTLVIVVLC